MFYSATFIALVVSCFAAFSATCLSGSCVSHNRIRGDNNQPKKSGLGNPLHLGSLFRSKPPTALSPNSEDIEVNFDTVYDPQNDHFASNDLSSQNLLNTQRNSARLSKTENNEKLEETDFNTKIPAQSSTISSTSHVETADSSTSHVNSAKGDHLVLSKDSIDQSEENAFFDQMKLTTFSSFEKVIERNEIQSALNILGQIKKISGSSVDIEIRKFALMILTFGILMRNVDRQDFMNAFHFRSRLFGSIIQFAGETRKTFASSLRAYEENLRSLLSPFLQDQSLPSIAMFFEEIMKNVENRNFDTQSEFELPETKSSFFITDNNADEIFLKRMLTVTWAMFFRYYRSYGFYGISEYRIEVNKMFLDFPNEIQSEIKRWASIR